MRIFELRKGSKVRTIYAPSRAEMAALRGLMHGIADRAAKACPKGVVHGFVAGRSPATNALAHVGHKYTVTMDLADFFGTVTPERLAGKLPEETIAAITVDGAARQGLPTSPAAANLAASDMDKAILRWIAKKQKQVVYTRYADDLSLSYDIEGDGPIIIEAVTQIVRRCGFSVAPHKTHIAIAAGGRRHITGVAVSDSGIHPTRESKRRLRAAVHQGRTAQAQGLAEWCKLTLPKQRDTRVLESSDVLKQVRAMARVWSLGDIHAGELPDKGPDVDLGESCILTGDPCYMLGMSTYTTGWTSCAKHPGGAYRRGTVFWAHLRGTRVAALLSDKTATHGGVARRLMRALWYADGRCQHHTHRPDICRDFERGQEDCLRMRAERGIP